MGRVKCVTGSEEMPPCACHVNNSVMYAGAIKMCKHLWGTLHRLVTKLIMSRSKCQCVWHPWQCPARKMAFPRVIPGMVPPDAAWPACDVYTCTRALRTCVGHEFSLAKLCLILYVAILPVYFPQQETSKSNAPFSVRAWVLNKPGSAPHVPAHLQMRKRCRPGSEGHVYSVMLCALRTPSNV